MAATAKMTFKLTGKVREFKKFTNSRIFLSILKQEVQKATLKNLLLIQDAIQQNIRAKKFKKNAKITQLLKGKDFPLVDSADMLQAIEIEMKGSFEGFVGFLKNSKSSHGGLLKKVVPLLQEGFTIEVTATMRKFLFAKAAKMGARIKKAAETTGTGIIVVPARPFLKKVFESKSIINKVNDNWDLAVKITLQRLKAI